MGTGTHAHLPAYPKFGPLTCADKAGATSDPPSTGETSDTIIGSGALISETLSLRHEVTDVETVEPAGEATSRGGPMSNRALFVGVPGLRG
jgi:hypothetical protein